MMNIRPPSRLQFSLRWLLAMVAIVAVLLGLLSFSVGQFVVGVCLLVVLRGIVPTAAVVGAVYARGDLRAFAIGALVPCISAMMSGDEPWNRWGPVFGVALRLTTVALCGSIAVVLRRQIGRPERAGDN